jgi:glycine hydroxymethyltransferase
MGRLFNFIRYKTAPSNGGAIDFNELRAIAREARPLIDVLAGIKSSQASVAIKRFTERAR